MNTLSLLPFVSLAVRCFDSVTVHSEFDGTLTSASEPGLCYILIIHGGRTLLANGPTSGFALMDGGEHVLYHSG